MDNIYYEIIVRDMLGDRHRHLTQILPTDDDEYDEGWLTIDIDEFETVRYNMDKIISWSYSGKHSYEYCKKSLAERRLR